MMVCKARVMLKISRWKLRFHLIHLFPFSFCKRENSGQVNTVQKMTFSAKDFLIKREYIRRNLRICSHLLKKLLTEKFVLGADKFHFLCVFQIVICPKFVKETPIKSLFVQKFIHNKPV